LHSPFAEEFPVSVKNLDPSITGVSDIDLIVSFHRLATDGGNHKLPIGCAYGSPEPQGCCTVSYQISQFAVAFVDHIRLSHPEQRLCRVVHRTLLSGPFHSATNVPFGFSFLDTMIPNIGNINVTAGIDRQTSRLLKTAPDLFRVSR
jgi:hypothetical protein